MRATATAATAAAAACALAAGACTTDFQVASQVLDLRVLAVRVDPPEQVAPFDPEHPSAVELADTTLCALVADPAASRRLSYRMVACPPTDDRRCDEPDQPSIEMATGSIDDPDESATPIAVCGVLPADARLLSVIEASVAADTFLGFGGVQVQVEIRVEPEGGSADQAIYAAKNVLYAPELPAGRVANSNPSVARIYGAHAPATDQRGRDFTMPVQRCADPAVRPLRVAAGEKIALEPIEPDGVREDYVLPTFDGGSRAFTENLTYAWYATAGEMGDDTTGGPKDPFGNQPKLSTTWTAPANPDVVGDGLDVAMWLVQRDERGGLAWYDMCARVLP